MMTQRDMSSRRVKLEPAARLLAGTMKAALRSQKQKDANDTSMSSVVAAHVVPAEVGDPNLPIPGVLLRADPEAPARHRSRAVLMDQLRHKVLPQIPPKVPVNAQSKRSP